MISPCISKCDKTREFCPGCGRTEEEKTEWKGGAELSRKKQILEHCASRLPKEDFEYWQEQYKLKVARITREKT
jgi:predicted Fe-S protein YdhL (DUF1289 family)